MPKILIEENEIIFNEIKLLPEELTIQLYHDKLNFSYIPSITINDNTLTKFGKNLFNSY